MKIEIRICIVTKTFSIDSMCAVRMHRIILMHMLEKNKVENQ